MKGVPAIVKKNLGVLCPPGSLVTNGLHWSEGHIVSCFYLRVALSKTALSVHELLFDMKIA